MNFVLESTTRILKKVLGWVTEAAAWLAGRRPCYIDHRCFCGLPVWGKRHWGVITWERRLGVYQVESARGRRLSGKPLYATSIREARRLFKREKEDQLGYIGFYLKNKRQAEELGLSTDHPERPFNPARMLSPISAESLEIQREHIEKRWPEHQLDEL